MDQTRNKDLRMAIIKAIIDLRKSNFQFWDNFNSKVGEHYMILSVLTDLQLANILIEMSMDMAWEYDSDANAYEKRYRNIF